MRRTILLEIKDGAYSLEELSLLWLYCKAWGAYGEHVLSMNGFWRFTRDNLRKVLFDLSYPDPDENSSSIQSSKDLVDLFVQKIANDNQNLIEWLDMIYKSSIDSISKREFARKII